jgi:hypothetical protein
VPRTGRGIGRGGRDITVTGTGMARFRKLVRWMFTLVLVCGSAGLVVVAIPLSRYPGTSERADKLSLTSTVVSRTTDSPAPGTLDLVWSESRSIGLSATSAGVVTKVLVSVGTSVSCGQVLLELDGRPIFAYCGERPVWRRLAAGVKGHDMEQLVFFLRSLGLLDADAKGDPTGRDLRAAIVALQKSIGTASTGFIDPADTVFVGAPTNPTTVDLNVGNDVRGPTTLMTVGVTLISATLQTGESSPASLDRVFRADSSDAAPLVLDAAGHAVDLAAVQRAVDARSTASDPAPNELKGFTTLATKVDVLSVPGSAVLAAPSGLCVRVVDGPPPLPGGEDTPPTHPVSVTVTESSLDAVFVTGDLKAGDEVLVSPDPVLGC